MASSEYTKHLPIAIFGLPLQNASQEILIEEYLQLMVAEAGRNYTPYHLAFVGFSQLVASLSIVSRRIKNPELLSILRRSDGVLSHESFLLSVARLLGSKIVEPRVEIDTFLDVLLGKLNGKEMSVFLLGGSEVETKAAAVGLHDAFHSLRLVGIATPLIFTEGEDLVTSMERDALLIEQINASHADMLIVNLGSPKQELWLGRVQNQLNIPLVLTVGNTLRRYIKQSSEKKKKLSSRERRFKHFIQLFKIMWMGIPLVVFHTINRIVFRLFYSNAQARMLPKPSRLFLSSERSIACISLPPLIDEANIPLLKNQIEDAFSHDVIVLDFLAVRHIQPEGFHLLICTWLEIHRQNKEIYGFSPSGDVKCLMKVHRVWDLFTHYLCGSAEDLMARLSCHGENNAFYDTFSQEGDTLKISILGSLDCRVDYEAYLKKLTPIIGKADCTIDFAYCTLIDNRGFAFLLKLKKQLMQRKRRLVLSSVNKNLRRQFKESRVEMLLEQ